MTPPPLSIFIICHICYPLIMLLYLYPCHSHHQHPHFITSVAIFSVLHRCHHNHHHHPWSVYIVSTIPHHCIHLCVPPISPPPSLHVFTNIYPVPPHPSIIYVMNHATSLSPFPFTSTTTSIPVIHHCLSFPVPPQTHIYPFHCHISILYPLMSSPPSPFLHHASPPPLYSPSTTYPIFTHN